MAEYVKSQYIKRQFGTIDTQRWQELQKMGISPEGMYMLTELLVGRHRNSLGVFYIPFTLATIAKNTGMKEVRVAKVFEELQDKDFLVMIIVFILFLLILFDKLSENNISLIVSGLFGYVVGRTKGGEQ